MSKGTPCPHGRKRDNCGLCKAEDERKGLERRIECEKIAAVQEFMDRVLGILRAVGMPTDDCDGDEAPETILSGWIIANWMDASHRVKELEQDKCGIAAAALNARECVKELLHSLRNPKFMAHAEKRAKELLATELPDAFASERAAGVARKPSAAEEKYNDQAQRDDEAKPR